MLFLCVPGLNTDQRHVNNFNKFVLTAWLWSLGIRRNYQTYKNEELHVDPGRKKQYDKISVNWSFIPERELDNTNAIKKRNSKVI